LHGYSHTLLGAVLLAVLAAWLAPGLIDIVVGRWNREVHNYGYPWLMVSTLCPLSARLATALIGTLGHLLLDALIHADMHPWWPLSSRNPFMGIIPHDAVYLGCGVAMLLGVLVWLVKKWWGSRN